MTSSAAGRPVHGGGRARAQVSGGLADEGWAPGAIQVMVTGADPLCLRRLVRLLAATEGIEVVAWGEPARPAGPDGVVVALHERAGENPGLHTVADGPAPALSPRQREVLAAYGAGNDLIDVVARRLGLNGETLKTHLRRNRHKYRDAGRPAPTRRDLYVRAVEDGLLPPPG